MKAAKEVEKRPPTQPIEAAAVPKSMLRIATVTAVTGLSKRTIYRLMDKDKFPKPVQLSLRCVAWRQEDVATWQAGRVSA